MARVVISRRGQNGWLELGWGYRTGRMMNHDDMYATMLVFLFHFLVPQNFYVVRYVQYSALILRHSVPLCSSKCSISVSQTAA